eukprot:Pompholyxophrys_punicea_v1_NODE_31_length_5106_cov_5.948276.p3 type:complete len:153 gc:universal NODE_31_length_5106_cov_5.948276:1649-1191(-)
MYGLEIWGTENENAIYIRPLLILQKRIVRIITYSSRNTPSKPLFSKTRILSIGKLYYYKVALLAQKAYYDSQSLQKYGLSKLPTPRHAAHHNYETRKIHSSEFLHDQHQSLQSYSLTTKIIKTWNSLPEKLRVITNEVKFKKKTYEYLLSES